MTTHASSRRRALSRPLALILALTAMILALGVAGSTKAEAKPRTADPTTVQIDSLQDDGGSVVGTFDVTRFAVQNGQLVAIGDFTGTISEVTDGVEEIVASGTQ